jgi:sugar phosphate isomerase/epimerase
MKPTPDAPPYQLAIQLYSLREFCKTPTDFATTIKKCRAIGYKAAQVSGIGPIDAREVRKICDDEGMRIISAHMSLDSIRTDIQRQIDTFLTYGCKSVAIGGFNPKADINANDWLNFADEYSGYAKTFKSAGLELGYHNHSYELVKYDGVTALDLMWRRFTSDVWMEIDTYWITHGGGDPCAWIDKVAGRIPVVHLKDMAIRPDRTQYMAEVGTGNLNWPAILHSCKSAGVSWYAVEQDICYRDAFDSVKSSYDFLSNMGMN